MMMKSQSNTMSTDNSSAMITTNITSSNNNSAGGNSTNQQPPALRCPRCDSSNTKFCYYNNYSLLQPRYFCKSCRRYWTKGGALRNVPVGGGCRKNKRLAGRQRSTSSSDPLSAGLMANHLISHGQFDPSSFPFGEHHTPRPGPNLSLLHSPDHPPPPSLLYFNLPPADHPSKEAVNSPSLHPSMPPGDHSSSHGLFSRQLASYLPSSLASQYLSNVSSLNPMQNVGYNHDYLASNLSGNPQTMHPDHSAIGGSAGTSHEPGLKAFSVALDHTFNVMDPVQQQPQSLGPWGSMSNAITKPLVHEQKLLTDHKINQLNLSMVETQGNMELGTSRFANASHLRHNLQSPKAEEAPTWPAQPTDVAGDQASQYWNNGGWQDMSGYNSSAHDHHPFM